MEKETLVVTGGRGERVSRSLHERGEGGGRGVDQKVESLVAEVGVIRLQLAPAVIVTKR